MTSLADNIRKISSVDGGILLDVRRGTMFRLNAVGSRILDLLDGGASVPDIAERLCAEFGVALDVVQIDLRDFLHSLELHGVLESQRRKPRC
jgi:hypothetical protein